MTADRSWSGFSRAQKRATVALGTVQLGLQAAALWDLHRRSAGDVLGSRGWWAAASFVNFFGPIAYFAVGRRRHPGRRRSRRGGRVR